ncbi:MAG: excinuclease ABC subunit UvrA [Burkholderiales bacterium]
MQLIRIRGARTHNLKNVNVDLPRGRLVVITGLSGSGKSSLAFDTLYAEGQRRYVESLSAYARQFLEIMEKPDVDLIEGLSPAISIEQKATSHNPRSTVGTITEINDYLRLLYARVGTPYCPEHALALDAQSVGQMVDHVLALPADARITILAPVLSQRKGEQAELFESLRGQGFVRVRIDGATHELDEIPKLSKTTKHTIEVVVDRLGVRPDSKQRLAESFETALRIAGGRAIAVERRGDAETEHIFSAKYACPICGYSFAEIEPRLFSFNSPVGACPDCDGIGTVDVFDPNRVVAHPELSLAGGAIRGWDKRNQFTFQLLTSLANHYGFDVDSPFHSLPAATREVILNGSDEVIAFSYLNEGGRTVTRKHAFEGVMPNLERRFRETDSLTVREELAKFRNRQACRACGGARLGVPARNVRIGGKAIYEVSRLPLRSAAEFIRDLTLPAQKAAIADRIVHEISMRIRFLINVGLDYLALDRAADTLSGGEAQRIRLASQIGSGLTGVLYVLDEPSIGLHQRDNAKLLETLRSLRDLGNTVVVVEHDEEAILAADHIIDIGPGAGEHGGHIIAEGPPAAIQANAASITGQYLSGARRIEIPARRIRRDGAPLLTIKGARGNNLRNVSVDIPVGLFVCVTGVSGSGKSTLVNDTLYNAAARRLYGSAADPALHDDIEGLSHFDKVVNVDQSPIGRTPRSNPATYTGLFSPIREIFAGVPEARSRGYGAGRFSFNVKGGRCEACEGDGVIKVEMHFLPDVYVTCDVCHGRRYNRETMEILYKGQSIHGVLDMTVEHAHAFFSAIPVVERKLKTLIDVGLGYVRLGQAATTLSGGEAQRVKLSLELSKREAGRTLYILDEPTTGLHFQDVEMLLRVLRRLRDHGNTIVVIEHNLDVVKTADWIIDLGPEGGDGGGHIVAAGTPEQIAKIDASHTGRALRSVLARAASHVATG